MTLADIENNAPDRPTFFRATMVTLIVSGWLAAWTLPWEHLWKFKTCLFRKITGIPCPFCDMTHACVYFARGQFYRSVAANALGPLFMAASVAFLAYFALQIARKAPAFRLDDYLSAHAWIKYAALLALGLNWALQIAKHLRPF